MTELDLIVENAFIDAWAIHFGRSPSQRNAVHEADAEIVEIPGDSDNCLAITIDTISEEIVHGLYQDPYTMGWVAVMASVSDLAAVAAKAIGLVISVSIETSRDHEFTGRLAEGMNDACQASGIFILGGDTNIAPVISLTTCAAGLVPKDQLLTRVGCKPGDAVFASGGLGAGSALGLLKLAELPEELFPESLYRPPARLDWGILLRTYASCCMDTSDGFLGTLDQLMRINKLGFLIDCDWERILASEVVAFCDRSETPYWLMSAGLHGEFELIYTVPSARTAGFLRAAEAHGFQPIRLGTVQYSPMVTLSLNCGRRVEVDGAALRNLMDTVGGNLERYVPEMRSLGRSWGLA